VVTTVDNMSNRVGMLARRMKNNQALQHTHEDWDNITDLLDRMKKLLAGEAVTVPPAHTPRPAPTPAVPPLLANPAPSPAAQKPAAPSPSPTPSPQ
jgi:cell division septation protein DedD